MPRDFYNGHLFEEEVLGRCRVSFHGYMSWKEAASEVRDNQPISQRPLAGRLEKEVASRLGRQCRLYTAVRSALDVFHGVDAFFEFHGQVVTIDLTMNPDKICGKADLIIQEDDLENLPALANRIVRKFAEKRERGAR